MASCLWATASLAAETPASALSEVTYHGQIAPILRSQCASCHRSGQPGPFPLLTYEDARCMPKTWPT